MVEYCVRFVKQIMEHFNLNAMNYLNIIEVIYLLLEALYVILIWEVIFKTTCFCYLKINVFSAKNFSQSASLALPQKSFEPCI